MNKQNVGVPCSSALDISEIYLVMDLPPRVICIIR